MVVTAALNLGLGKPRCLYVTTMALRSIPKHYNSTSLKTSPESTLAAIYYLFTYIGTFGYMCPYTIITFSVNGYVLLTGFPSFTPLPTHDNIMSTIVITTFKITYRCINTAGLDIDHFIFRLSTLTAAEKSSETNGRMRRDATIMIVITSTGLDPINESNRIPILQGN